MDNNNGSNSDKLKNALCYIPFAWIVLFFTEQNKSAELMKHIKYGTFLFIAFVLIRFIIVWILLLPISWILFLIYLWIIAVLWWKSYNGEDVNIEYIDEFEKKVKENLNDTEKKEKTEVKKEESNDDKKDDDLVDF